MDGAGPHFIGTGGGRAIRGGRDHLYGAALGKTRSGPGEHSLKRTVGRKTRRLVGWVACARGPAAESRRRYALARPWSRF